LINGTSCTTAIAAVTIHDAKDTIKIAQIAAALTINGLKGTSEAFHMSIHHLKPHNGQLKVAGNLGKLVQGSPVIESLEQIREELQAERSNNSGVFRSKKDIQNAYSLRCTPQILGPVIDTINFAEKTIITEINSVTDNPLLFPDEDLVLHGGNFHAQPIAMAMDYIGIALTEATVLSERRIARILDDKLNNGLPPFLVIGDPGLKNCFMGLQYLPSAMVAENRVLSTPASIMSVSTNANNQDVVSMGPVAALKANQILQNLKRVIAVELITGAQAGDIIGPENLSPGTKEAYDVIRGIVEPVIDDRTLDEDIHNTIKLITTNKIIKRIESVIGELS
jgi:histidine ammonia-lyase